MCISPPTLDEQGNEAYLLLVTDSADVIFSEDSPG